MLGKDLLDSFMEAVRESGLYLEDSGKTGKRWYLTEEPYQKKLRIVSQREDGILLKLCQLPVARSRNWEYVFEDQKIYRVSRKEDTILNGFEDKMQDGGMENVLSQNPIFRSLHGRCFRCSKRDITYSKKDIIRKNICRRSGISPVPGSARV